MASRIRVCLRSLAALILLAVCGLCLSRYSSDTRTFVEKLPLAYLVNGGETNNPNRGGTNNDIDNGPEDADPYDVIILTYMRSGSTFIGKILGARDDTFYWYEPLWVTHTWKFHSKGQLLCNYGTDGCKNVSSVSSQSVQQSLKFLLDFYKCNLKEYFNRFNPGLHGSPVLSGRSGAIFRNCMGSVKNCNKCVKDQARRGTANSTAKCGRCPANPTRDCYNKWIERCNTTRHRSAKVLRMDTSHAMYLLENHKRLKLVQVFRDPRGTINSRQQTGNHYVKGHTINEDAKVLCKRIENDLAGTLELKALFPDRVKIIQYEDFYDPNRTAKILYEFLNMKMTDYVKRSILAPLIANSPNKRAAFHPDTYREKLNTSVILGINKYCKTVFDSLGLRTFNNAHEVKNGNLSVILDKLPYPLD